MSDSSLVQKVFPHTKCLVTDKKNQGNLYLDICKGVRIAGDTMYKSTMLEIALFVSFKNYTFVIVYKKHSYPCYY